MISRRTLFRGATLGLGGLYFAPFLRQLEAVEGAAKPMRIVFFVQGNGVYPDEIQPAGIERPRNPTTLEDRTLAEHAPAFSLEPLAPWAAKTTMLHGLSGRIARGSHNSGFAALGCWPMGKKDYGETIDAAFARLLGGIYPHVGLGVSNNPSTMTYNLTSTGKGRALPTLLSPVVAHRQYFAAGAAGEARKDFDLDTNLLDFLADDVKRMQTRLTGSEHEKLERYLEAFESMSGRQSRLAQMADRVAAAAPTVDPKLDQISVSRTAPTGVFDRLEAQCEVAAGATIARLTAVITISAAQGTAAECHALIRRKCLEKLAMFLRKLEAVPEGEGSMLDNTLVVYMSDSAEGHHPVCREWPFVLIGDLGGRLKLGDRYLRYPEYGKPGHRTIANFYLSLLAAAGEHRETFGYKDSALLDLNQDGPLEELMV